MEEKQNWEKGRWSGINSESDMIIENITIGEDRAEVLKIGIK